MSYEKDAYERLITLKVISPDSFYSPSRAKDGWYSATLKTRLKEMDEQLDAVPSTNGFHKPVAEPSGVAQGDLKDQLKTLASNAERIYLDKEIPPIERLIHMREAATNLMVSLRDAELQRFIWDVRRKLAGVSDGYGPDEIIETPDLQWLHDGALLAGDSNLIVGLPKANKTTYVLGALGAAYRGESSFLGRSVTNDLPPIFIAGTDQPGHIWQHQLKQVGFVSEDGKRSPHILKLFTRERPIHLTPDGIERMAQAAEQNPGLIFLLDSYHALVRPLDVEENSPAIADPFLDFLEAVAPYNATTLLIHHANKGSNGRSATFSSRGNTALPAAASQTLDVSRLKPDDDSDHRRLIKTEGRLAEPIKLLATYRGDAGWEHHGNAEQVEQAEQLQDAEDKLSDRQYAALSVMRERWDKQIEISQADLEELKEFKGSDRNNRRRVLDQLVTRGLATSREVSTKEGRLKLFCPVEIGMSHLDSPPRVSLQTESTDLCDSSIGTKGMSQVIHLSHIRETPPGADQGDSSPDSDLCPDF